MSDALHIEHEIQRLMLERLKIEWVAGEPFYSLVEAEIVRLRTALQTASALVNADDPDLAAALLKRVYP